MIFGIAVIVIGVEMLFRELKSNRESSRKSGGSKIVLVLIGIISGLLCGLYGVGALLAAVFLGMKSSSILNEKIIKKIVIVLLILSGIVLIINNL